MIRLSKIKVSDFCQWSFFFLSLHMNRSVCLISCFFCHLRWDWMLSDLSKVLWLLCNQSTKVHSGFSMLALWNDFIHKVVRKWQTRGAKLILRWIKRSLKGRRFHVLTFTIMLSASYIVMITRRSWVKKSRSTVLLPPSMIYFNCFIKK